MTDEHVRVGCSQLAAVFGAHPFLSPYGLWARLTGRVPPKRGIYTAAGHLYESVVRSAYLERHSGWSWDGSRADYSSEPLVHDTAPLSGHPDGIITTSGGRSWVADAKYYLARGLSKSRELPAYCEYQVRGYMALLGLEAAQIVAVWSLVEAGGNVAEVEMTEHVYERDMEIEDWMLRSLTEWYNVHVVGDRAPVAGAHDIDDLEKTECKGESIELAAEYADKVATLSALSVERAAHAKRARALEPDIKDLQAELRQALGEHTTATIKNSERVIERRITEHTDRIVIL